MSDSKSTRPPFSMPETRGLVWPVVRKAFFIWPVVIFIVLQIAASIYRAYQGSIEGPLAAQQLQNDSGAYARSLLVIDSDIPGSLNMLAWGVLILFIVIYLVRLTKALYDWKSVEQ